MNFDSFHSCVNIWLATVEDRRLGWSSQLGFNSFTTLRSEKQNVRVGLRCEISPSSGQNTSQQLLDWIFSLTNEEAEQGGSAQTLQASQYLEISIEVWRYINPSEFTVAAGWQLVHIQKKMKSTWILFFSDTATDLHTLTNAVREHHSQIYSQTTGFFLCPFSILTLSLLEMLFFLPARFKEI